MRSEGSIVINRPIEEVFQLTNEDVSLWSIVVVENQKLEETPGGVGSTFHTVTEDRGRRMEFAGTVTRHDPPYASAVHMTGQHFDMDVEYLFEDYEGHTRVTQVSHVHGKGLTKVMFFCCGWMFRKAGCDAAQKELESLKHFCEGQPAGVESSQAEAH